MIDIFNNSINDALVGSAPVKKICVGPDIVWEKSTPVVPYDSRVEWLYSSGNGQYIDTGIVYNSSVTIEASVKLTGSATGNYMFGIYTKVNDVAQRWAVNCYSSSAVRPHFGTVTNKNASFSRNVFHTISANYRNFVVDGTTTNTNASAFTPEGDVKIFLFCRSNNNTADTFRALYIDWFKIRKDGNLVRDYISVRKDGVGYLYDKISNTLFGNLGTNSFTYGNDVV